MSEWKEVRLGDITDIIGDGIHGTPIYDENGEYFFINGSNLYKGKIIINNDTKKIGYEEYLKHKKVLNKNTILLSINGTIGNIALYNGEKCILGKSACYININHLFDKFFIFYILSSHKFLKEITFKANGTTIKNVSLKQIRDYTFYIPSSYEKQKEIAGILSSLDAKIETNNKLNEKLEEMAQAIFKSWFVDFEPFKDKPFHETELGMIPEGWEVVSLTDIATFTNGLAMQKFRPNYKEPHLPVLKIKELRQGFCDDTSEICIDDISDDFIADDGDIIFSWSGTLLVDIWCGGKCGVNQHLFKVTSEKYNKWFFYFWIKRHLAEFIRIAKDKAVTMGHIKRGHLTNALVVVPNEKTMQNADKIFTPIIDRIIEAKIESKRLASLRDTLLPRLMSGELIV